MRTKERLCIRRNSWAYNRAEKRSYPRGVSPVLAKRVEDVAAEINSIISRVARIGTGCGYSVFKLEMMVAKASLDRARLSVQVELFPAAGIP